MPEPLGRIDDMLAAIEMSETILQGARRTPTAIEMRALERTLEIVSEASRHIPESLKANYADTPWRQIAGIRDRKRASSRLPPHQPDDHHEGGHRGFPSAEECFDADESDTRNSPGQLTTTFSAYYRLCCDGDP